MNSPFTAKLCRELIHVLDHSTETGSRIESWPNNGRADALALRLCGALHSIVIHNPGDDLAAIYPNGEHPNYRQILSTAIKTHDEKLNRWLDLPPQTNEIGRASALLPGLLEISRKSELPIHMCEIGSSAGLNLQLDKFYYEYNASNWGNNNSPVNLNPIMNGKTPDLSGDLNIASRIGCDISPIDIKDPSEQLRLRSYIWPDQKYRTERINSAIKLALANPPELLKQDAADFVEAQLKDRTDNTAFALMHSVVWQYLPTTTQDRITKLLQYHGENSGPTNPIYWLRLEGLGGKEPSANLLLDSWPNHQHDKLANACFHASWIEFF